MHLLLIDLPNFIYDGLHHSYSFDNIQILIRFLFFPNYYLLYNKSNPRLNILYFHPSPNFLFMKHFLKFCLFPIYLQSSYHRHGANVSLDFFVKFGLNKIVEVDSDCDSDCDFVYDFR